MTTWTHLIKTDNESSVDDCSEALIHGGTVQTRLAIKQGAVKRKVDLSKDEDNDHTEEKDHDQWDSCKKTLHK